MSKKDTVTKEYMSKRQYFADAFNSSVFDGKQIIKADEMALQEMDPTELGIVFANEETDKIIPVISLVVYFGSDKWDGPRSLKEMFPEDIDSEILDEVEDYRLHMIIPAEITDFSKFKTDLGKAMKYIAVSESRSEMGKLSEDEMFRTVGADTVRLINECTGSNIEVEEEEEVVDMCNGLRELLEEERQKGRDEVCNGLKELMEEERQKGRDEVCNGLKELMEEERQMGKDELLNSQVSKKARKNLPLEKIAEDLEEDIEVIRPIYEKVKMELDSKDE